MVRQRGAARDGGGLANHVWSLEEIIGLLDLEVSN